MTERMFLLTTTDLEAVFAEWWRQWKNAPHDYIDLDDAESPEEYGVGATVDFANIHGLLVTTGAIVQHVWSTEAVMTPNGPMPPGFSLGVRDDHIEQPVPHAIPRAKVTTEDA